MYMQICDNCHGPTEQRAWDYYRDEEIDPPRWRSPRDTSSTHLALKQLHEIEAGYEPDTPFFSADNLTMVIGAAATEELLFLHRRVALVLGEICDAQRCSSCDGPIEELFNKAGVPRGPFPLQPEAEMAAVFWELFDFKAAWTDEFKRHAPAEVYDPAKKDDEAPMFSERYLYALLGKDDARSVLAVVREAGRVLGLNVDVSRNYRLKQAEKAVEQAQAAGPQ